MPTYLFYADQPHKRRADGRNVVIAQGADATEARLVGEALLNQDGALSDFAAVDVTASIPPVIIEGHPPVGAIDQAVWPTMSRGGGFLGAQ